MCTNTLCHIWDAVRRKRPEKLSTNIWFTLNCNAPAHRSVLVKDFSAKSNETTLEHLPYSTDLPAADFYLFPRVKSVLKLRYFRDYTATIKKATEELKRFSQNGLQGYFQHHYSFWKKGLFAEGDYFEGN